MRRERGSIEVMKVPEAVVRVVKYRVSEGDTRAQKRRKSVTVLCRVQVSYR